MASAILLGLACRSPLADLPRQPGPLRLAVGPVQAPAKAPKLKRLLDPSAGEVDSPEARAAALEAHRAWLEGEFRREAEGRGLALDPDAPLRLELHLKAVGDVPISMALWGFGVTVAYGVLPGVLLHNEKILLGLLVFELVEEGVFWFGGSALLSGTFAPVVLEAELRDGAPKPMWRETYYVLRAHDRLLRAPPAERSGRQALVRASLGRAVDKLFADLEAIPGFPKTAAPVPVPVPIPIPVPIPVPVPAPVPGPASVPVPVFRIP